MLGVGGWRDGKKYCFGLEWGFEEKEHSCEDSEVHILERETTGLQERGNQCQTQPSLNRGGALRHCLPHKNTILASLPPQSTPSAM